MNYTLNKFGDRSDPGIRKPGVIAAIRKMIPLMKGEGKHMLIAFCAILVTSGATLSAPLIIAHTINAYIIEKQYGGVLFFAAILFGIYLCALVAQYIQTLTMGGVGRRVLFNLRNALFNKLQELPVAVFN